MTERPWIEHHLTETEVQERRMLLEQAMDERDQLNDAIAGKKSEIKIIGTSVVMASARIAKLRGEIRTRIVLVRPPDPQQDLPLDAAPAPGESVFDREYPLAASYGALVSDLRAVGIELDGAQADALYRLDPRSGKFDAIAQWARVRRAREESGKRPPVEGLVVPLAPPEPAAWIEVVNAGNSLHSTPAGKKKRGKRAKRAQGSTSRAT